MSDKPKDHPKQQARRDKHTAGDWLDCECSQCGAIVSEMLARWDSEQALRGTVNANEQTAGEVIQDELYYLQLRRDNRKRAS